MASENILELEHIDSGYGDIEVLRDISFSVRKGQIISILGANGAGKSTLMKSIFGFRQTFTAEELFTKVTKSHMRLR